MSVEALALGAGKSVAKIVVGRWLAGRASKEAAGTELIDMIKTGVPDEFMRRKASNKFEDLALSVSERLRPYLQHELRGLDDWTREAALEEVVRTLEAADLSDNALLADDADPVRIARRVRALLPRREAEFQLGEAGARLYEVLLAECCDCLAHTLVHLPEFSERAAAESLSRLSEATASLETVLARLPARTLDAPEGDSLDEEFTRRYLTSVTANLDRLELFGVRLEQFTRPRTTLSVAYISLNVTDEEPDRRRAPGLDPVTIAEWREERRGGTVRVERALGEHRLMLIRGEAGGGKSTLLRWVAISAARGAFTGDLAPLNGHVPFVVKLRSHAGQRLPRPEEFLDDVAPELAAIMPDAWVHRCLQSGRAVLLVDGIDEIVASQRHQVREWLGRFTREYPAVRAVVTSRPAAAEADWLKAEGFRSALLEPLTPADLKELVKQWHLAIRDSDDLPCAPERLPAYEARLLARLESAPHLRTLASTPLLAAMLCALNLDRNSLPRDRMSLYAAAIDMLLETRDTGRDIPSARENGLERDQKMQILRELAWHLSTSNRVELPKSTAQRLVIRQVEAMPQVRASGEKALELLLQRSGIIREPIPGRIDFVHRTIGEYLTAEHAADLGDMELLIRNAHLDQWRETIIMAAGHANRPQQAELVKGVLGRAEREEDEEAKRQLQFLAAGCLETLPSVSANLRTALDQCLDELIPPQDTDEAGLLAAIGEPILRALPEDLTELPIDAAEATIRTAWLINGPESLKVLRRYAADERYRIQRELSTGWNFYDSHEYVEQVLTAMPPGGTFFVTSAAQLALLTMVPPPSDLTISLGRGTDLSILAKLPTLKKLEVTTTGNDGIGFLRSLPPLSDIWIGNCQHIKDYSPLQRSTELHGLVLFYGDHLRSLSQLPPLGKVTRLGLVGSKLGHGTLANLVSMAPKIRILYLGYCDWVDDLAPLSALQDLEVLTIEGIAPGTDLSPLAQNEFVRVYIDSGQDVRGGDALGDRLIIS